jgi:hypothetical protein
MTDGAIVGFNIPLMIRAIGQGRLIGIDRVAAEKTKFSELTASFAINNGIVRNDDLRILSSSATDRRRTFQSATASARDYAEAGRQSHRRGWGETRRG